MKKISTQLDNMKIKGDSIQNIIILYSEIILMIFAGINGLVLSEPFDKINKSFNFRKELILPNAHLFHNPCM